MLFRSQSVSVSGINSNVNISGFNSASQQLNIGGSGLAITVGDVIYKSNGDKVVNGVTTNDPANALAAGPTLDSLNTWINEIAGTDVQSQIIGSNNTYSLLISAKNNADAISLSGLDGASCVTELSIGGFQLEGDPIALDTTNGFELRVGEQTFNTKTDGVIGKTYSDGANVLSISSLSDLCAWINGIAGDHHNQLNIAE